MRIQTIRPLLVSLAALSVLSIACSDAPKPSEEVTAEADAEPATPPEKTLPATLDEALKADYRQEANLARDVYRHPKETLEFFGLEPNLRVVEIAPGGGWYSEILAPLLSANGAYFAAIQPPGDNSYMKTYLSKYQEWLAKSPELKAKIVDFVPGKPLDIGEPADLVLTFRNVHNWQKAGTAQDAFRTFYKSLKPGGVLGVVEHRANPKGKADPKGESGYMKEKDVIRLAEKAGFRLDKSSEINANPKDTKNYPKGVWTLPPSLAEGEKDKEKYLAIGESDRMTLRFVKPVGKSKK